MPRFAANLTMMFAELPLAERFAAARRAGFDFAELLFPYSHPAETVDKWIRDAGIQLVLINTPLGDREAGERGLAGLPGRESDFETALDTALEYATCLGAGLIHVMLGIRPEGINVADCDAVAVSNLKAAANKAAANDVQLLLEPLNHFDTPGYLLTDTDHAAELIARIGCDNVGLQYDFYHRQIMQGNVAAGVREHFDVIKHIQFSSVPGRHEPQYGELNMPLLFDLLDELGYRGFVGAEYRAKTTTPEGLTWGAPWGLAARSESSFDVEGR